MTIKELKEYQKVLTKALPGTYYIKYCRYMETVKVAEVFQANHVNIWIGQPPFAGTPIEWNDVLEIYSKETNPEYFL